MAISVSDVFDDLLHEQREFPPAPDFRDRAVITDDRLYEQTNEDVLAYWEAHAKELSWFKPWKPPHVEWFAGGSMNIAYKCIDRHLDSPRRNKAALIWEGEDGAIRTLTRMMDHRRLRGGSVHHQ